MNRKKKIIIGIILILIFALCFIPSQKSNSKYKLNIVSTYGDNEAYHPKVLSFKNGWNGYKYWMSYTPYPKGDDSKENPHIAVSNDLINWKTPEGLKNPIDERVNDGVKEQYNSDSHIVYNSDTNELECYWRFVDDANNQSIIYRKRTKDGINWGEKEITAHSYDRKQKDYVSPAIIYENKIYKMWYVDQKNIIKFAVSTDGINWIDKQEVKIEYEENLKTWHLDVISSEKGYEMITVAFDKWTNHNKMNLYYTSSLDGINWKIAKVIIKPASKTNNWDNLGIYRSSFIYEDGKYYIFYGGTSKDYHHGVGVVYGKNIYNLKQLGNKKQIKKTDISL